jgi:hypothetical protein
MNRILCALACLALTTTLTHAQSPNKKPAKRADGYEYYCLYNGATYNKWVSKRFYYGGVENFIIPPRTFNPVRAKFAPGVLCFKGNPFEYPDCPNITNMVANCD